MLLEDSHQVYAQEDIWFLKMILFEEFQDGCLMLDPL